MGLGQRWPPDASFRVLTRHSLLLSTNPIALSSTIFNLAIQLSDVDRKAWIEIGTPNAARLHKASKASPRLAVYIHKPPHVFLRQLAAERIHRADAMELYAIDRELIDGVVARLERRMMFDLSVTDRHLFVTIDGTSIDGPVRRLALADA